MLNFLFGTKLQLTEDFVNALKSSINVDELVKDSTQYADFSYTELDTYITKGFGRIFMAKCKDKNNFVNELKKSMDLKQLALVFPGTDKNLLAKIAKGISINMNKEDSTMASAFAVIA